MTEIPLEIASSSEIDVPGQTALQNESLDPSNQQTANANASLPGFESGDPVQPDSLTTASLENGQEPSALVDPNKPLSPQVASLRAETDAKFAALAAEDNGMPTDELVPETYPGISDPAEIAARERVTQLYASMEHGQCKGGWGPTPKMINAARITPGHPYYMEMRLRHTPLLPVGHVYIAYGDLGPDGQLLNEGLIMLAPLGGYIGAGIAGTIPMPGVLTPHPQDCTVKPEAGYRISLSAQDYEKLLLAIQKAKADKPNYHLLAYNCNHFMSDIAKSVGILPPRNIYKPSLVYFYEMMDRNEGRRVPRTPANMSIAANRPALQQ